MTNLSDLRIGDRAKVLDYGDSAGSYRRKLLTMGITRGVELEIVRVAPMGDPIEIHLRGFSLSLRKEEAAHLLVEKLS